MNNIIAQWCGIVVAIAIAAMSALGGSGTAKVGNVTQSFWDAQQGFKMNGTIIHNATVLKTTTAGGTLTVTTSDTATSTASFGCIQTTATSTATPIKLRFYASTSPALAGDSGVGTFAVVGKYGNCP